MDVQPTCFVRRVDGKALDMTPYRETRTEYVTDEGAPPPTRPPYLVPLILVVAVIALVVVLLFSFGFGRSGSSGSGSSGGGVHVQMPKAPSGGAGH